MPLAELTSSKPKVICILGMHRSGTSAVARAINLLGFFLGDDEHMMPPTPENAEGYWEHLEIVALQERLLAQLNLQWDISFPLPENWHLSETIRPFRDELKALIVKNFSQTTAWAWKDPRSCLLMPLWRDVLEELQMELNCVFVTRNPVDVRSSLIKRDQIPSDKATVIWLNYSLTALEDTIGVPTTFIHYDRFLASWETELRRCAADLNFSWPTDEAQLRATMNAFLRPELRHNRSNAEELKRLPRAVRELYDLLLEVAEKPNARDAQFDNTISKWAEQFRFYATCFEHDMKRIFLKKLEGWQTRARFMPKRWKRSAHKRILRWSNLAPPERTRT